MTSRSVALSRGPAEAVGASASTALSVATAMKAIRVMAVWIGRGCGGSGGLLECVRSERFRASVAKRGTI
jgi:hypothetical protein